MKMRERTKQKDGLKKEEEKRRSYNTRERERERNMRYDKEDRTCTREEYCLS